MLDHAEFRVSQLGDCIVRSVETVEIKDRRFCKYDLQLWKVQYKSTLLTVVFQPGSNLTLFWIETTAHS